MGWGQGSTRRWRELRTEILRRDPICRLQYDCCIQVSTEVDHIVNREAAPDLRYEPGNLQGVCPPCHARKTQSERTRGQQRRRSTQGEAHPGVIPPDA